MPPEPAPILRSMVEADLERAVELTRDLVWPHREEDWALFFAMGEGIVAEIDGQVEATALAIRYGGGAAASVGLVIVDKAQQGKGLGRAMMAAMLERLEGCSVTLQATVAGAPLYEKLGFVDVGQLHQHQGVLANVPLAQLLPGERIRPLGAQEEAPGALYSQATGTDRSAMTEALARQARTVVLTRDHSAVGFAMLRRFGRGWQIGPVVAPDEAGAKALVLHWLGQNAGHFTRIDVGGHSGLSAWLEGLGLPRVDSVRTMVRGAIPASAPDVTLFAITAQAMG